jgi:phosphoribosylformylglycinamidine synthase
MALAGDIGATVEELGDHATAFGEDQGRYVVTSRNAETIQAAGFPMTRIGTTGGKAITGAGRTVPLDELRAAHEGFFPNLMRGEPTVA